VSASSGPFLAAYLNILLACSGTPRELFDSSPGWTSGHPRQLMVSQFCFTRQLYDNVCYAIRFSITEGYEKLTFEGAIHKPVFLHSSWWYIRLLVSHAIAFPRPLKWCSPADLLSCFPQSSLHTWQTSRWTASVNDISRQNGCNDREIRRTVNSPERVARPHKQCMHAAHSRSFLNASARTPYLPRIQRLAIALSRSVDLYGGQSSVSLQLRRMD
jgi:hypothetical protein